MRVLGGSVPDSVTYCKSKFRLSEALTEWPGLTTLHCAQ